MQTYRPPINNPSRHHSSPHGDQFETIQINLLSRNRIKDRWQYPPFLASLQNQWFYLKPELLWILDLGIQSWWSAQATNRSDFQTEGKLGCWQRNKDSSKGPWRTGSCLYYYLLFAVDDIKERMFFNLICKKIAMSQSVYLQILKGL